MQPFTNARNASDDLTEADKWALSIGIVRAKEQCARLAQQNVGGEDLLAMGKLCVFGQEFEAARQVLIAYLALQQMKAPEVGRLLLIRAFLGVHSVTSAESQIESLLSLYPYDASIHLGIDMIIDAAEAGDSTENLDVAARLTEQQLPHILDALAHGGSLHSNGDAVDPALLVRDALRCADAQRRAYQPEAAERIVTQVKALVAADAIAHSADYPAIEDALARYAMFQASSPVRALRGTALLPSGATVARSVLLYDADPAAHRIVRGSGSHTTIQMLDDRTLVLVFSLAGPASAGAIQKAMDQLAHDKVTPGLKVVAVTSFAANIGEDAPNATVFAALRTFRSELPPKLPVMIVPDELLKPFAIDGWPAAILFDGQGRILWLNTISGSEGSVHEMVREIESPAALPLPH